MNPLMKVNPNFGLISLAFLCTSSWATPLQIKPTASSDSRLPVIQNVSAAPRNPSRMKDLDSQAQTVLKQASLALHRLANQATPAVVSITAIQSQESPDTALEGISPEVGHSSLGIGSGVMIRGNGTILTNSHVIDGAERVTVWTDDQTKFSAEVLGMDPITDLAVLQITPPPATPLPSLRWGDSDRLSVGDWILTVGSPYGLVHSVTSGIISALGRTQLGVLDTENFIQTDAAINPGSSGGPLLNTQGEVVGINTAIFSQSGGFSGIGFAIPSNTAKKVLEEILKNGRVIRGWAGISAQDLNEDLTRYFHLPKNQGALICDTQKGSPADLAQLRKGDVIVSYRGKEIHSASELKTHVTQTPIHSKIPVDIIRSGEKKTLEISILEHPEAKLRAHPRKSERKNHTLTPSTHPSHLSLLPDLGIKTKDLSSEIANLLQVQPHSGVLISQVKLGSPGFEAGLLAGDLILSANETVIRHVKDFQSFLKAHAHENILVFYIQRGPVERLFISVKTTS